MADIKEPLFWTPSAIQNFAKEIHDSMLAFNNDMAAAKDAGKLPAGELEAWRLLRERWTAWYGAAGASTWLFSGNVSVIESYANALSAFRQKFAQWMGRPASGASPSAIKDALSVDTSGTQKVDFDWTPVWWGLGAAAVIGVGLVWYSKSRPKEEPWGGKTAPTNWRAKLPPIKDISKNETVRRYRRPKDMVG